MQSVSTRKPTITAQLTRNGTHRCVGSCCEGSWHTTALDDWRNKDFCPYIIVSPHSWPEFPCSGGQRPCCQRAPRQLLAQASTGFDGLQIES